MAKKKTSKASSAKKEAQIRCAAKVTGLSQADLKRLDAKDAKAGRKSTSFLACMLDKTEKHLPKLRAEVARRAKG